METASLSKTVRLSNDELGLVQRRVNEIVRRVEEGKIELPWALAEMQRVIEGRKIPEVKYRATAEPLEFKRPLQNERGKSKAGWNKRLPHMLQRLAWPDRNKEHIMAEMWEAECIPHQGVNYGATPMNAIMGDEKPTDRDIRVINSALQWLGTNVGSEFLTRFVRVSQLWIA